MKGSQGKHNTLVNIIADNFEMLGIYVEREKEYPQGQIDVYIPKQSVDIRDDFYCEVKCNIGNEIKAALQIERALKYKQCTNGFMSTYQGALSYKNLKRYRRK